MVIALAATHHDPDGRLYDQTARILPLLCEWYSAVSVVLTPETRSDTYTLLQQMGVHISGGHADLPRGHLYLGLWRRLAVEQAVQQAPEAAHIHFCDLDRVLHWAEYYPEELKAVLAALAGYDFTVLGRTPRAFNSHPRAQRDTESVVNHVFAQVTGMPWDVTTASRGLSHRVAQAIVAGCHDDTVGSDCSWPLFVRRRTQFTTGYLETEGLEFETLDRYGDEVSMLGGADAWIDRYDADPRNWELRLELARLEVAAIAQWK